MNAASRSSCSEQLGTFTDGFERRVLDEKLKTAEPMAGVSSDAIFDCDKYSY